MSRPRNTRPPGATLINTPEAFDHLCETLATADRMGIDAEFVAEDGYRPSACLIQVVVADTIALVDPLAGIDVKPLWQFVSEDRIEKVVHAGVEDLAMCFHETGRVPQNVFDVQIAAGMVGLGYPLSLLRLARSVVGARLHKSQTLTNWRQRPLTDEQLRYAADDVAYLLPIHDRIRDRLKKRGRTDWALEEFQRFSEETTYRHQPTEMFRRVKGAGSLDGLALAVLRELAIERERLADVLNRPRRAVVRDHLMIAIARYGLAGTEKLKALRGLNLRPDSLSALAGAVQRGLDTPVENRPKRVEVDDDTPAETTLCKLISAVLSDFCHAEGIGGQLLASGKDVRALVLTHTRGGAPLGEGALQRSGWRQRAIGDLLHDVLAGKRSVRVISDGKGAILSVD